MTDFANSLTPLIFEQFEISSNTTVTVNTDLVLGFREGFTVIWGQVSYVDGTYALVVKESEDGGSTGTAISSDKIIIPELNKNFAPSNPNKDPLLLIPGSTFFWFGIKEFVGNGIKIDITSTGVTLGAEIFIVCVGHAQRTPVDITHFA